MKSSGRPLGECRLKAFAAIETFEGRSKLSTWLTRIVINEALARLRSARRHAARAEQMAAAARHIDTLFGTTPPPTPDQFAEQAELRVLLEQAIARLPVTYRIAFVLREIEGMTVDEVAAALNVLPATVKIRHFRARRMLQADLAPVARDVLDGSLLFGGAICVALTERVNALIAAHRDAAPGRATLSG
ncbi:sigma-70 family RNA polymerase sigma factor [Sphingomonas sp.]|uniref:sigma-70 family RNA polymerase sigma factor n=1 Tax=Sphingomonas sp. TaxID=28214 RepID=UPI0025F7FEB5|nr:sigma-70 family RNA polymerase sigma factor [Sphingomonas sp.]